MKNYVAKTIKCLFVFPADNKPAIDPGDPVIEVTSGGVRIIVRISPKNARKLASHAGPGKIEGRLVLAGGRLELIDASAQVFDVKPPSEPQAPSANSNGQSHGSSAGDVVADVVAIVGDTMVGLESEPLPPREARHSASVKPKRR